MTVVPNRGKDEEEDGQYGDESCARCRTTGAEIGKRLFLRWALGSVGFLFITFTIKNMKKKFMVIVFIVVVMAIGVSIYFAIKGIKTENSTTNNVSAVTEKSGEDAQLPETIQQIVALNENFTLKEGETAEVADENLFVTLTSVGLESPASQDGYTLATEPSVVIRFSIIHVNKSYTNFNDTIYHSNIVETDEETTVTMNIITREQLCNEFKSAYPRGDGFNSCWLTLAKNANDKRYCENIEAETLRVQCDSLFSK
jgi:hypothetical protein